jgi:hypothetical protein
MRPRPSCGRINEGHTTDLDTSARMNNQQERPLIKIGVEHVAETQVHVCSDGNEPTRSGSDCRAPGNDS